MSHDSVHGHSLTLMLLIVGGAAPLLGPSLDPCLAFLSWLPTVKSMAEGVLG